MVRAPLHWRPMSSGRAVYRWDGFDADGVDRLDERSDLWHVVQAYGLPAFSIITSGNRALAYRDWRTERSESVFLPDDAADAPLRRRGTRLERDYFLPRSFVPRVSLEIVNGTGTGPTALPRIAEELELRVGVPQEDRWVLDASFYETSFYIDYRFQSEEEQGFVPMVRRLDTRELSFGRHIATVQLFGFGGFIASASIAFERH